MSLTGVCTLVWRGLWNFIVFQVKFNRFLYPNKHTQMIFWYLVRRFGWELSKIGHFQSSASIFGAKYQLNLPRKWFSFLNIKLGEQLSLATFSISIILKKVYLIKMCPIFNASATKWVTRYQKILFLKFPWGLQCT